MRLAPAILATVLVTASASRAVAAPEDDARGAMTRGLAAFANGDMKEALAEYETAKRLAPLANAPYYHAAQVLQRLGRWREAVENLETYLERDPTVSDANEVKARIASIRREHLPGRVRVEANVTNAEVFVDGENKGHPGVLELAPGTHRLEVRAPAHQRQSKDVEVEGDTSLVVSFVLSPLPPASPDASPPAVARAPAHLPWRTVGWITAGVGAASIATSVVVDAGVLGPAIADYRAAADRQDTAARGLLQEVDGLRTGVLVGYVAGAALLVGGVVMALIAPASRSSSLALSRWDGGVIRF